MTDRSDWGNLYLVQIKCGGDFWDLFQELCDDKSGFIHNKITIIEAYKDGNLYGLKVSETDAMYERNAGYDTIFSGEPSPNYLLPCFCITNEKNAIIIWTHSRARRMGFGKKLIQLLEIENAVCPLIDSLNFWRACRINIITKNNY